MTTTNDAAGLDGLRIWLMADQHAPGMEHVKSLLEERGAAVEVVALTDALERALREQSGKLLEGLKVLLRRARREGSPEFHEEALSQVLDRGRPDLILVSSDRHLRDLEMLGRLAGGAALRVGVLPDYNLGAAWLKGALSAYIVPHEALQRPLLNAGIEQRRVFVAGPPVGRAFAQPQESVARRAEFGLDRAESGPVVFVLADALDPGELDRLVLQMTLVGAPWQPIFYVGEEGARAETLRRATRRHGLVARMLGPVQNLPEFLAAAHLVVLGAQDSRVVGALALDRPLLLLGAPGAVTTQVDFLLEQGVALHVADLLRLGAELESALRPERLTAMEEAARAVGRPTGAAEVVEALASILARRAELDRQSAPGPEAQTHAGPFEVIGARAPQPEDAPQPAPAPEASPLSAAEAKDELAALIMRERDLERRQGEAQREAETWRQRFDLAREWNEAELAREAEERLQRHLDEAARAEAELATVREQKERLKARVRQPRTGLDAIGDTLRRTAQAALEAIPVAEERFRDMEVERDLSSLRERLKRELGE